MPRQPLYAQRLRHGRAMGRAAMQVKLLRRLAAQQPSSSAHCRAVTKAVHDSDDCLRGGMRVREVHASHWVRLGGGSPDCPYPVQATPHTHQGHVQLPASQAHWAHSTKCCQGFQEIPQRTCEQYLCRARSRAAGTPWRTPPRRRLCQPLPPSSGRAGPPPILRRLPRGHWRLPSRQLARTRRPAAGPQATGARTKSQTWGPRVACGVTVHAPGITAPVGPTACAAATPRAHHAARSMRRRQQHADWLRARRRILPPPPHLSGMPLCSTSFQRPVHANGGCPCAVGPLTTSADSSRASV